MCCNLQEKVELEQSVIGLQGCTWVCRGIHEFTRFTGICMDKGDIIKKYQEDYIVGDNELYSSPVLKQNVTFSYYRDEILSMLSQQW